LLDSLTQVIAGRKGRVAVTCFASNVARLETIAAAARANDRDVVIAGRSLRRIELAARACGYLQDTQPFIDEADAGYLPADKTLIICTGSQGEPRAALSRIASGNHPNIDLGPGDAVIFSSRVIPGNEVAIGRLHNQLIRRGIEIITSREAFVHVSGHPAREELSRMYALIRPRIAVPVHGELRHLAEHAQLARSCQVPRSVVTENGGLVRLAPGEPEVVEDVPSGRLFVEGNRVIGQDSELVRERTQTLYNGAMVVTVVLDDRGLAEEPQITAFGLFDGADDKAEGVIRQAVIDAVADMRQAVFADDAAVGEAVRLAARRAARSHLDKRPVTRVHVVRT
jgi:ribonuclease J